jgi:hypothetical protein
MILCSFPVDFLFLEIRPLILCFFAQNAQISFGWNVGFAKRSAAVLASFFI